PPKRDNSPGEADRDVAHRGKLNLAIGPGIRRIIPQRLRIDQAIHRAADKIQKPQQPDDADHRPGSRLSRHDLNPRTFDESHHFNWIAGDPDIDLFEATKQSPLELL